ncbi:hypothetical protein SCFA_220054 [anaerobic digester metagenome]|uniref:Uncharacterized protein n=1 Tax=anaerobic digester metagenome TaxID=1263854 RepID=A0A485LXY4_9ZZZZ
MKADCLTSMPLSYDPAGVWFALSGTNLARLFEPTSCRWCKRPWKFILHPKTPVLQESRGNRTLGEMACPQKKNGP